MDQPLGAAVGNAVEVREAIEVLRGGGPADVRALTVRLGAEMLVLGRRARDLGDGARRIERGDRQRRRARAVSPAACACRGATRGWSTTPNACRARAASASIRAGRAGVVVRADAGALGRAATLLGAGRLRKEDRIAPGAAIMLAAKVGTPVARGEALCTLHYDDEARADAAAPLVARAFRIGPRAPRATPLVLETLGLSGVALTRRC